MAQRDYRRPDMRRGERHEDKDKDNEFHEAMPGTMEAPYRRRHDRPVDQNRASWLVPALIGLALLAALVWLALADFDVNGFNPRIEGINPSIQVETP